MGGRREDLRGGKGDLWERKGEAGEICRYFLALEIKGSFGKSTGCSHFYQPAVNFPTALSGFPAWSCLPDTSSREV